MLRSKLEEEKMCTLAEYEMSDKEIVFGTECPLPQRINDNSLLKCLLTKVGNFLTSRIVNLSGEVMKNFQSSRIRVVQLIHSFNHRQVLLKKADL